jgi:hypothetical protein
MDSHSLYFQKGFVFVIVSAAALPLLLVADLLRKSIVNFWDQL